jgi:FHA domain-containing protein
MFSSANAVDATRLQVFVEVMTLVVVAVLIVAIAAGAAVPLAVWWSERRRGPARPVPPLIYPLVPPGHRDIEITPMMSRAIPATNGHGVAAPRYAPTPVAATPSGIVDRAVEPVIHVERSAFENGNGGDYVSSETIRFRRPSDEPVQILPGRLEVVSGESRHREIRFVRVPGEPAQLIVGREPGRSPQHVTLQSSTVSRLHARFAFNNGRWAIANLSQTNPVVVNDEHLLDSAGERPLADGDKIELGEVVLRYRSQ